MDCDIYCLVDASGQVYVKDGAGAHSEVATSFGLDAAVCDAYRAMTEDPPYRNALTAGEARRELREGVGTQFDGDCVAALLRVLESRTDSAEVVALRPPSSQQD